jgi:pilus assembly protein CpaB
MNPARANRRFILLAITLGLLGAILVYVSFSRNSGSSDGAGAGAANAPVVVAREDIPARTKITQSMIEVRLLPNDNRSPLSYNDASLVIGQVTRFPLAANEQVLSSKVVSLAPGSSVTSRSLSFAVPQGKRAFAVNTSSVAGAGGLILPGDYVDVMVIYDVEFQTKPGDQASRQSEDNFLVQTVLQNIEVLALSQTIVDVAPDSEAGANGQRVRNSEAKPQPDATTVTMALTPEQAQRLYLAESNGRLRLALRPFGDGNERPIEFMTELELFPPNLPNPFLR